MIYDRARLASLLGAPERAWILERLQKRIERGEPLTGVVTLRDPSAAQRESLDRLLGRAPSRGGALQLALAELLTVLRHGGLCDDLREATCALLGPLRDLRAERAAHAAAWAQVFATAASALAGRPALVGWLLELQQTGLLRRLAGPDAADGQALLQRALRVLGELPATDVLLPELAAVVDGDAHALDMDAPLGRLVVRGAAALSGVAEWRDSEGWRRAWDSVGVRCDEVSSAVKVLNLRPQGESLLERTLREHAREGRPCVVTLQQLRAEPLRFAATPPATLPAEVFVCENPAILQAAAARLGARSRPLVCLDGRPRTATHELLALLRGAAVVLRYHGDFDWWGVQIANQVMQRHGAVPWCYGAAEYRPGTRRLHGAPVDASWDAALRPALLAAGTAMDEEAMMDLLLAQLDAGCPAHGG